MKALSGQYARKSKTDSEEFQKQKDELEKVYSDL